MKLSHGELGVDDSAASAGRYHRQELITWWDQDRVRSGPPPGKMNCPNCQLQIPTSSIRCEYCNVGVTSPDGVYRGPTQTAPGAVASLVFGILEFFLCGIIFGIVAIQKADEAKTAIASDPSLTGGGIATTGKVLGIIALVVWGLGLIMQAV